jgi:hypothetical protein
MADESVRVAAYFHDEDQRKEAEQTLTDFETFASVVEGEATVEDVTKLTEQGVVVEVLPQSVPEPTVAPQPEPVITEAVVEDLASQADLPPRPDQPTKEQALDEDVYRIQLRGPITEKQRLEFWDHGVDIFAFEPPDRYKAFLTREQYAQVQELPYVAAVSRYGFEDSLSPELVNLFQKEPGGGLAGAGGDAEPETFEAMLHREKDMDKVRPVIEQAEGNHVVGTSNLRIRFTGPADPEFLSRLAAMPYVAKVTPYNPPRL